MPATPSTWEDYAGRNQGNGIDLPETGEAYGHRPGFRLVLVRPADAKQLIRASVRLRPEMGEMRARKPKSCARVPMDLDCGLPGVSAGDF